MIQIRVICQYERNMNRIVAGFFLLPMVDDRCFVVSLKEVSYGSKPHRLENITRVGSIKIYTEVYGQGKPLLLIHGNGGSIKDFSSTIPFFSKRYQVIAVDSRAQGKTIDHGDSLSFEMMADDFAELLNQMHMDSTFVIGWSDGGINAILLALRHPEKVIKMVSTGANMTPDSSAIIPSSWIDEQKQYERDKNKTWTTEKEKKNDWKAVHARLAAA